MTVDQFWQQFLQDTGKDSGTTYFESFFFGLTEDLASELLALVLCGKKRATASSLQSFGKLGQRPPQPGDYSIVTDFAGNPKCVIRTVSTMVLPFNEMTFDICKREGEDDCLESWQAGHRRFFGMEARQMGYEFTEDMPVLFEDFEVVYVNV